MPRSKRNPLISQTNLLTIEDAVKSFLIERRSRHLSPKTVAFYKDMLDDWLDWMHKQNARTMGDITSDGIRKYMLFLEETGHKPGGIHCHFRAVKVFCRFWEEETEGAYRSPTNRVKPPKVVIKPLPGVKVEDVIRMVNSVEGRWADRDAAILMSLLDTGARRAEFCNMDIGDINVDEGVIHIRGGKGDKDRWVFVGRRARRAIRKYLRLRDGYKPTDPLWVNDYGERLKPDGLRQLVRRRARAAGVPEPGLHDFRRAFALQMHRNGVDNITLSRQMGHSGLEVLKRYLDQNEDDLHRAHERSSPVDNANF